MDAALAGRTAPLLIGQAPRAAAELLRHAVTRSPARSARHDSLLCRYAEALYRVGDAVEGERVASRALADIAERDLVVNLHWTLAQCRSFTGRYAESLSALDRPSGTRDLGRSPRPAPGGHRTGPPRPWARRKGRQVATAALTEATDAADNWATGWALHVLTVVAMMQARTGDALGLDRALTVTQGDPALTDLRILLQINKAVTLGDLDQYEGAFVAARQAQELADRSGLTVRRSQAHCCLGELLFNTGQSAEALTEVGVVPEDTKDPGVACCDHGIAAVISFHRGDTGAAQQHLAAAAPHAKQIGNRVVGALTLARSLDADRRGD